ncbi:mdm2-binding protein-like [Haliotis rufescens]|uniref:mdm2-binding protein-like n=1 Tax=Haliotis rufescens TaxID=6454 RepID=UPI00201EB7CA|nr:mdm2-binding protein-like [Haliotis rufescens]
MHGRDDRRIHHHLSEERANIVIVGVMAYILFIAKTSDPGAVDTIHQCLEHLVKKQSTGEKCLNSPLAQVLCTDNLFKTAELHGGSWVSPGDLSLDQYGKESPGDEIEEKDRGAEENSLSHRLLQVSESLPYAGVDVHIVLVRPTLLEDPNGAECYLPLFGALKKLSCWHNAEITIITDSVSQTLQDLGDFTGASFTSQISSIPWDDDRVWRGKVAVMNKVEGQGHVFPGFQLRCDGEDLEAFLDRLRKLTNKHHHEETGVPVMGRMLEVLDQVDARTLPSFMLTHHKLQLSVWHPHHLSMALVQELLDQEQTAVIARLAVYDSASVVDCTQKLSAQAWRESVMANVDYVIEQEEDLLSPTHFLHVVLRREDSSADHLTAVVLRDSSEVNAGLFRMDSGLYSSGCGGSPSGRPSTSLDTYLSGLPHITGEVVDQLNTSLVHMQTGMLQDWIAELEQHGESTVMSVEMLYKFLGQIQQNFLDQLFQDGVFQAAASRAEESNTIPTLEPDVEMDPLDWPERKAVQHQDTQKREMRRYQSSESACLSSPPHPDDGVSTIEVKDFIKLFNPDGSAYIDKLSPIRQQSRRKLTKLSSQGETTLLWPDCMDTLFHGIDYYKDKISEKNEKHYSSLREKFIKNETCSSFTTKRILTKKKPHKSESGDRKRRSGSLMSPSRKSPRGPLTALRPMKEEIRPMSQPSRQKMVLQHPGLKSPRKRMTLTSERLRRSPRKQPSASFQRLKSDSHVLPLPPKRKRRSDPDLLNQSDDGDDVFSSQRLDKPLRSRPVSSASVSDEEMARKQSRSERHKKKLEQIVKSVLVHHGVDEDSAIFKSCADKLFQVTKFFVKTLPNSRNLSQEMKNIAEGQVTQVVDLEKRRQEMKRPSRK